MATLTVRDIPDEVLRRLKAIAAAQHRSLNGQILVIFDREASLVEALERATPQEREQLRDWLRPEADND
jgi:plasmid stability protein